MGILGLPPIEQHQVTGRTVFVVRDDLCCPFPGPNNSKMRGLEPLLDEVEERGFKHVVSVNTKISRLGWGISWMCGLRGLQHHDVTFRLKPETFFQRMSRAHSGDLIKVAAAPVKIAAKFAKVYLGDIDAFWLPMGLRSPSTFGVYEQLLSQLPELLWGGTVILSCSSGTIASALIESLWALKLPKTKVYGILPGPFPRRRSSMIGMLKERMCAEDATFAVVDAHYQYHAECLTDTPFPCDRFLDRKAWAWLTTNIQLLPDPVTFWNIGGEWDCADGLGEGLRGDGIINQSQVSTWLNEREQNG